MKKKYLFILLLAIFAALSGKAQNNIAVASFRWLERDLTANLEPNIRIDQNGHTCALIKVVTTQTGFTFDVGIMGITDTRQEPGEIWLWVPFGINHMTIRHPQLGVLRDYRIPISVAEARTYEMVLTTGKVSTIVEEDLGGSYLMMTVEPKTAQVYIDDKPKPVENGEVKLLLPYGRHSYRVEAASFMNEAGIFEIGKERTELNITLKSARATLTVNCTDAEADIYINEEKKSRGSWTGQLDEGMYAVEARKAGHRTVKQSLTLAKQEQKALTLNAPQPVYGKLNLDSSPGNCEVYLDGTKIGKSPDVFSNILVGNHTVELRKNGYESQSRQISIEENKIIDFEMTLQLVGAVAQQPEVQQTVLQPQQSEKPVSLTDKKKTFIMGNFYFDYIIPYCYGLTFGQVREFGWYVNCYSNFGYSDDKDDKYYIPIGITGGAVFRCAKPFYLYTGAGSYISYYNNLNNYVYIEIEAGCMFHFKHFSIMAGYSYLTRTRDGGFFQLGLGFNF